MIRFATRRSALALAQSRAFVASLVARHAPLEVEEVQIVTSGDKFTEKPLQDLGGKGLFIKELEEALYDGRADLAVHSFKDVPAELAPGLRIACVPEREDPRDALVSKSGVGLAALPDGARVGTSSLRRAVCLKAARPDLRIEPLRGNVDTRLRRVKEGDLDAAVLAVAGLKRLGLAHEISETLNPSVCLPAIAQGALAIEIRTENADRIAELLAPLEHAETAIAVSAERALMAAVGGNCRMPIAAHATRAGDAIRIEGLIASVDGTNLRRATREARWPSSIEEASAIGLELAAALR
ncbi:MAG: hydroxymethylbilane synthase [Polyangiaceae bacterium]